MKLLSCNTMIVSPVIHQHALMLSKETKNSFEWWDGPQAQDQGGVELRRKHFDMHAVWVHLAERTQFGYGTSVLYIHMHAHVPLKNYCYEFYIPMLQIESLIWIIWIWHFLTLITIENNIHLGLGIMIYQWLGLEISLAIILLWQQS